LSDFRRVPGFDNNALIAAMSSTIRPTVSMLAETGVIE
jgi:hypothetical protein